MISNRIDKIIKLVNKMETLTNKIDRLKDKLHRAGFVLIGGFIFHSFSVATSITSSILIFNIKYGTVGEIFSNLCGIFVLFVSLDHFVTAISLFNKIAAKIETMEIK